MSEVISIHRNAEYLKSDELSPGVQKLMKEALSAVKLPEQAEIPAGADLMHKHSDGGDMTVANAAGENVLFRGRLEQCPPISIYWIPKVTESGKIYAVPSFMVGRSGGNPQLIGASSNILAVCGVHERIIGDVGPLEQILPDVFGVLEPLGVKLTTYELQARVKETRAQILLVLNHLKGKPVS